MDHEVRATDVAGAVQSEVTLPAVSGRPTQHPILRLVARRILLGLLTLLLVSILVFWVTLVLPGDAAQAILGRTATPESLAALREQLHLNDPAPLRYWEWLSGVIRGDAGMSLAAQVPVWDQVGPRLVNSAILLAITTAVAIPIAMFLGILAGVRRDTPFDTALSTVTLAAAAVPEFVIAIGLVVLLASVVLRILPPVSLIPPGQSPLDDPVVLVLPVLTLTIAVFPYIFRMVRASMIECMSSEYVEMARLKGMSAKRVVFWHALPNALPTTVQAIGLTLAYLAGGVVVVEYIFGYSGIGDLLVVAVTARDVPVIQLIVVLLAAVYVTVNITTDTVSLLLSPKARAR